VQTQHCAMSCIQQVRSSPSSQLLRPSWWIAASSAGVAQLTSVGLLVCQNAHHCQLANSIATRCAVKWPASTCIQSKMQHCPASLSSDFGGTAMLKCLLHASSSSALNQSSTDMSLHSSCISIIIAFVATACSSLQSVTPLQTVQIFLVWATRTLLTDWRVWRGQLGCWWNPVSGPTPLA